MMKSATVFVVAILFSGCAFLTHRGVLEPGDVTAICKDVAVSCAAANLIDADEDVKKACLALQLACASSAGA